MQRNYSNQLHLFQVKEIEVSYYPQNLPLFQFPRILSSQTIYDIILSFWNVETIEYKEEVYVVYLNRANEVIGVHRHSIGGLTNSIIDVRQILAIALKGNACSLIISHNHPSKNLRPSQADIDVTQKLKQAAKLMDIALLDHLIITRNNYYSFADEGML